MAKCQIAPSRGIFQVDYFWVLTKLGGRVLPKSFSPFLKKLRLTFNMRTTMRRGGQQKQMSSRKKILYTVEALKVYKGHNGDVMIIIQGQNKTAKYPKNSSTNNQRALFATTAGQPIPHLPPCRTISHASAPISSA